MAIRSNGALLIHVDDAPVHAMLAGQMPVDVPGYSVELLAPAHSTALLVAQVAVASHWLHAKPQDASLTEANPWDQAHRAAQAMDYAHFVEPDIIHERAVSPAAAQGGAMDPDWAPCPHDAGVSPGWHLETGFTGFAAVRGKATGAGIRIAHLDTGYTPNHMSKPRCLRTDLGWDYVRNTPDPVDPGASLPVENPGHGTATLGILAGNTVTLSYKETAYQGDLGGAPDADVIPVRISESVIHIASSTMFKGLMHALAPRGNAGERANVVTISHGGLPAASWADAINQLYMAGVVVVAASGDCIHILGVDIATHFTVYPSAFNRVVTALGATYAKAPYITAKRVKMQGCWGPPIVMDKAIAAFTPNVAWMRPDFLVPKGYQGAPGSYYEMSGSGTSASTPQVAAAAALFLQAYATDLTALTDPWRRVEACRLALFDSAATNRPDRNELGWGLLDAERLLAPEIAAKAIGTAKTGEMSAVDKVSHALWRFIRGKGPPNSAQDAMYETEVAQVIALSKNPALQAIAREADAAAPVDSSEATSLLLAEQISAALRAWLTSAV